MTKLFLLAGLGWWSLTPYLVQGDKIIPDKVWTDYPMLALFVVGFIYYGKKHDAMAKAIQDLTIEVAKHGIGGGGK